VSFWAALFGRPHRHLPEVPEDFPNFERDEPTETDEDCERRGRIMEAQERSDDAAKRLRALEFEQSLYRRKRPRIPLI